MVDRRRSRLDQERRVRRVPHAADDLELGRAEPLARARRGVSSSEDTRCPAGSIGCSHRGHGGRPPVTASAPRAAMCPHLRARGVDARHVAGFVVGHVEAVGVTAGSERVGSPTPSPSSSPSSAARSRSSSSTSSRSGSKPRPISRARNSGTVGSCRLRSRGRHRDRQLGDTRRRCGRGRRRPRVASSAICSFSTSTVSCALSVRAWM